MAKLKRSGRFFVYILRCRDGTFYTGYTPDLARRLELHNSGKGARYTRSRRPVTLVWSKEYRYFKRAFLAELKIKKLKRKQKVRLIGAETRSSCCSPGRFTTFGGRQIRSKG
ncbi:MAG: GIY-YIG nuclease family protein [Candidatus Aminicenantes bacterium]|nr:GIY-YIG nuclease family protein [Candidatus Aminicenantes bacterium]